MKICQWVLGVHPAGTKSCGAVAACDRGLKCCDNRMLHARNAFLSLRNRKFRDFWEVQADSRRPPSARKSRNFTNITKPPATSKFVSADLQAPPWAWMVRNRRSSTSCVDPAPSRHLATHIRAFTAARSLCPVPSPLSL